MAAGKTASAANPAADRLKSEVRNLFDAVGEHAVSSLRGRVSSTADRLSGYVENGGGPGLAAAVRGARGLAEGESPAKSAVGGLASGLKQKAGGLLGRKGKAGGARKQATATNIIESIDVGVPVSTAYDQWTRFTDFPGFLKKVESVEQVSDEKLRWKAQIFWSHREWESTIVNQVPDDRIVWRSKGAKGHVDGAVTFHELAPNLTRIVLVLEYHPQGLFERTGNLWRAQGRRARLELKHFQRHVMTQTILEPDEVEGWRGVIEDSHVVETPSQGDERDQRDQAEEPDDNDTDDDNGADDVVDKNSDRDRDSGGDEGRRPRSSSAARSSRPSRTRSSRA